MGDAELVQVVDMGDAKVQGSQEDDLLAREVGQNVERNDKGAPD